MTEYWGNYWVHYVAYRRGSSCGAAIGVDATDADDALTQAKRALDKSWGPGNWKLKKIRKAPTMEED